MASNQSINIRSSIMSLTIVSVTAIIAIMTCCLASLGYNSRISLEKEKIEVVTCSRQ